MLIANGTQQAERNRQMSTDVEITELLNAANSGDAAAQDAAYEFVYAELKRCARRQSALTPGSSLSPTALVSELYLKLSEKRVARIDNRRHFIARDASAKKWRRLSIRATRRARCARS